jgi:hypothetical protein
VVDDDAVVVVDDLGLVAELGGVPEPAAADRPGVGLMQVTTRVAESGRIVGASPETPVS